jgi:hypothetical protein
MNPKDIAFLKWANLSGDYLTFEREVWTLRPQWP